jgi:hypothetical protein
MKIPNPKLEKRKKKKKIIPLGSTSGDLSAKARAQSPKFDKKYKYLLSCLSLPSYLHRNS